MIPGAILMALKNAPWKLIGIGAVILMVCALIFTIHLKNNELADVRADNAVLRANVAALETAARANDQAAQERASDTSQVDALKKDLTDAIKDVPPGTAPGAATVLLGCQRLRNAGARPADLPAACGSRGGK